MLKQGHFICFNLCSVKRTRSVEKVVSSSSSIREEGDNWTTLMKSTTNSGLWLADWRSGRPAIGWHPRLPWVTALDIDWTVSSPCQVWAQVTALCETKTEIWPFAEMWGWGDYWELTDKHDDSDHSDQGRPGRPPGGGDSLAGHPPPDDHRRRVWWRRGSQTRAGLPPRRPEHQQKQVTNWQWWEDGRLIRISHSWRFASLRETHSMSNSVSASLQRKVGPRQGGDPILKPAGKYWLLNLMHFIFCRDLLNGIELGAEIVHIPVGDVFQAEKKTCYLLQKGVVAIFGPRSKSSSEHIKYITDSVEIPYIETRWNYRSQNVIGIDPHFIGIDH